MAKPDRTPSALDAELKALDQMRDEDIDTTDIPETADWSAAERGALYRPNKVQVTIRLDADIIHWFQAKEKRRYQTRINAALRDYISRQDD